MAPLLSPVQMLAEQVLNRLEAVLHDAERQTRPLEMEPYRGQLFELFVTAHGAGLLQDDGPADLTADGLLRELAERWGLADAARQSTEMSTGFQAGDVGKMRLLWSLLRMWMEWTYAWRRWPEFHDDGE